MDENLKYYKVTGPDIKQDVVLGIKPEQVDETMRRYGEHGYTLEETEAPKGAVVIAGERHVPYDSPTCARCKNRYKRSDFCDRHCADKNCYRFKLER